MYLIACNDHIKTELQFIVLSKKYIKKGDIEQMHMKQNNIKH